LLPGLLLLKPCFYLVSASPVVEAGVTETPRYLIKTTGQAVTLRCSTISKHSGVSWYQQALSQDPHLLFEFYENVQRAKGEIPNRFSAQQLRDYRSELNVRVLELMDSALYLCASSVAQPCRITSVLCTNLLILSLIVREHAGSIWFHFFRGSI
uniref:Ig-like domain-containing protein n=1 Tax=Equus asinus TaxID=9793 RepID=A0A8C4LQ60_EQUAS